jgi:hypothetical protein
VSKGCHRIATAGLAVLLLLLLLSDAESRHHGHYRHSGGSDRDDAHEAATRLPAGPLGTLMRDLTSDCDRQLLELKNLPTDSIAKIIEPDNAQANALKDVRKVAEGTATALAATCPRQDPATPPLRLAAAERGIGAVEAAMEQLQPPLETFYQSLRDEQRARLATGILVVDSDVTGGATAPKRSRRHNRARRDDRAAERAWDCGQWIEVLRTWPLDRVQRSLRPAPRQRGPFYEMVASFQFAADSLEDSCPRQEIPTPTGRLEYMKDKLEALHQAATLIRAPLGHFYEVLDDGQKTRFGPQM